MPSTVTSFKNQQPGFWRDLTTQVAGPDGTNDVAEGILHNGTIHFGASGTVTTPPTTFEHLGIVSYVGNGAYTTQVIQTTIPDGVSVMPTIHLLGYNYSSADSIDLLIPMYVYLPGQLINSSWTSRGSRTPTQVRIAIVGGFVAVELTWPAAEYFQRWQVNVYCDGNSVQQDEWFQGWTVTGNATIAADSTALQVVPQRFPMANTKPDLQAQLHMRGRVYFSENKELSWAGSWRIFGEGTSPDRDGPVSLNMPTGPVPVAGGTTRALVDAGTEAAATGGIPFNNYESLWYQIRVGDGAYNAARWLIQPYASASGLFGPSGPSRPDGEGWVMVCYVEGGTAYFGDGSAVERGGQFANSMHVESMLNKHKQTGLFLAADSSVFFPDASPATAVSFGYGGANGFRVIAVGREDNELGPYIDIPAPSAGTPVYGFNASPNLAWRALTPADNVYQFGEAATTLAGYPVVDIPLQGALWWAPRSGTDTGQWYVTKYEDSPAAVIPDHWLLICINASGSDSNALKLWDGTTLRRGELRMGDGRSHHDAQAQKRVLVQSTGRVEARLGKSPTFAGTGANGVNGTGGVNGVLVGFEDSSLIAGMGGPADDTQPYLWLDLPSVGTAIPVMQGPNASGVTVTRVVRSVTGSTKKWVPLGQWEALVYIPRPYGTQNSAQTSGWMVVDHTRGAWLPPYTILVAKHFGAPIGYGVAKSRIILGDGSYISTGTNFATATEVYNDHATGTTEAWRPAVLRGATPPGGTATFSTALAAVAASTVQFRTFTDPATARGCVRLIGNLTVNAAIPDNTQLLFLPGVSVPVAQYFLVAATHGANTTPVGVVRVQAVTAGVGGQFGCVLSIAGYAAGNASGGAYGANGMIAFDGITLEMA